MRVRGMQASRESGSVSGFSWLHRCNCRHPGRREGSPWLHQQGQRGNGAGRRILALRGYLLATI
jgi:hypothetical protein